MNRGKEEKNPMFEAARKGLDLYLDKFKDAESDPICFKKHVWQVIIEGDPKSPKVMQLDDGDNPDIKRFLVYYPKNSTPYYIELVDDFKTAKVLDGSILNQANGKVYHKHDIILAVPGDKLAPKTGPDECHVFVEVSNKAIDREKFIYRNCDV